MAVTKVLTLVCVDGESYVWEMSGRKRLKRVKVGDRILAGDRDYHEVIAVDFGETIPGTRSHMLEMVSCRRQSEKALSRIITTPDHVIDGKPMDQWQVGETIQDFHGDRRVLEINKVATRTCGDLLLKGCDSYYCEWFKVQTHPGMAELLAGAESEVGDGGG